jgi:hypothetical protein
MEHTSAVRDLRDQVPHGRDGSGSQVPVTTQQFSYRAAQAADVRIRVRLGIHIRIRRRGFVGGA